MTYLPPGGTAAADASTMTSRRTQPALVQPSDARHLDRDVLRSGIIDRRRRIQALEHDLVAKCELAARRNAAPGVCMDDRATWDRATWNRYLAAATQLEPEYGAPMRRLYQEIDRLERLTHLPVAA